MSLLSPLLLSLHLWCVNLATALPLFAMWFSPKRTAEDLRKPASLDPRTNLSQQLAIRSLAALTLGIILGLIVGVSQVWQGDRALLEVLPNFEYKLRWGVGELVFYYVCMGIYLALDRRQFKGARVTQGLLAVLASTNLLYHFPPLFTIMSQAAAQSDLVSSDVRAAEFRQLMTQGHVIALWVHVGLACFAVAGVELLAHCAKLKSHVESQPSEPDDATPPSHEVQRLDRAAKIGAATALIVTALQLLVGVWLLTQIDTLAQHDLTGGNLLATGLFAISVVGTFGLLHLLAGVLFAAVERKPAEIIRAVLFAIVFLMTSVLGWIQ